VLTQAGRVGFEAGLAEALERQTIALRLELGGGPERHAKPPPLAESGTPGLGWRRQWEASERPLGFNGLGAFSQVAREPGP